MRTPLSARLDRVAARHSARPAVSMMSFAVEQPSTGFSWSHGDTGRPYFIASITKLYTVAMVMQLRDEGALTLDTRVAELLGADTMRGLNVHGGHDHGPAITVRELLTQTSGIPDYFEQERPDGTTFLGEMLKRDAAWTFEDFIEMARSMPSRFAPSTPGRAHYCDTNYQLLGRVIEVVTSGGFEDAFRNRIVEPLGLDATWLFTPRTLDRYDEVATILHGGDPVRIPKSIASFPPDGAVVSTSADQLRFLRAFFGGELFPARYLAEMTARWNPVFSRLEPIDYGMGVMRFRLPRWLSPFTPVPEMVGHSGAFGNVLYHVPERDLYVSGTVNQMLPRSLPHQIMFQLVAQFR
ncbi:serine hydrolase domain-containing protein [Marinactinospora thermotolerans]|uniref:CubicO group peptidase, beta-lactamase class C family n=1 Tax=Marinactinospora thermotolerans DSM 45154 TaxID=1122192 RepID=A0A1T4TH35_9ACTN|nr:serine hydrolase domain-containing protein [Marinactinospora thermotolerans]SKA39747.1 CubicO group peptidase, beta-lactamase class C family [Marinactinospora thermotolerans DSM 45154]